MERQIIEAEILNVVARIWALTFQLPISVVEASPEKSNVEGNEWLRKGSSVSISGRWNGTISTYVSDQLIQILTMRLFQISDPGEVSAELCDDTLRELTNLIAGNVKTVLPEPCHLSLPSSCALQLDQTRNVFSDLPFHCEGQSVRVVLAK